MAALNTDTPEILSVDLLEELAERWRKQDASIADLLRPGLSHGGMDELTAPVGITLPREAKIWWGWHDGALPYPPSSAPASFGPQRMFSPLAAAVESCVKIRDIMRGSDGEFDDDWKYEWLPLSEPDITLLDCSVAFDAPVPVRSYSFEEPDVGAEGVPSIGTLVKLYIGAIDCGEWFFNHRTNYWGYDATAADPATTALHLT